MLTPLAMQIVVVVLAALCTGGLLTAAFYPRLAPDRTAEARRRAIAEGSKAGQAGKPGDSHRKRSLEDVLREIEEKQKAKQRNKVTLTVRMRQAGLRWTKSTYYSACAGAGIASFFAAFAGLAQNPLTAVGFGIAGGLLLPHFYVNQLRKGRFKRFTAEFANAMDVIVRGLKAGLPLADCMKIIASEGQEPVRSEFRGVIDDQAMGIPADEALQRMAVRMPVTEANFFSIVIAIQSRSGGSLSEALANLSKVLRERQKMRGKIRAMSQEAKSSAMIIGVMPLFVTGAIYLTSPDYITLLFTTTAGNLILAGAGFWMLIGVLVMRKMINFDF